MADRSELFAVARMGTKLSLTLLDGELGIGITNMASHTGVAVPITRDDAAVLARALMAFRQPERPKCATCGEPAHAHCRRLYHADYEASCLACLPLPVEHPNVRMIERPGA